jgi:hypothetical protein
MYNMIVKKILLFLGINIALLFLSAGVTSASEGNTTLQSIIGGDSTCDAKSALMADNRYTILITCKDLLYPPTSDTNAYVVWATPTGGGSAFRLGALGFGRAEFKTQNPFSALFVTRERVNNQNLSRLKDPGAVVMRGTVNVDPEAPKEIPAEIIEEIIPEPTTAPKTNLLGKIGTGAIITIISIVLIIVMLVLVKPFK